MTDTLANRITKLRRGKGLTLEQLGERTQSSKSYIWELESGKRIRPSAVKIAKLAEALDTTIDVLIGTAINLPDMSPEDQVFMRKFARLSPERKKDMAAILEVFRKR